MCSSLTFAGIIIMLLLLLCCNRVLCLFLCSPVPEEYNITLQRAGNESLGFSIVGGVNSARGNSPVFIRNIAASSIAHDDGRLHTGDKILKINGVSVSHMSQNRVVQVIKNTVGNVTLTVMPRGSGSGSGHSDDYY